MNKLITEGISIINIILLISIIIIGITNIIICLLKNYDKNKYII